MRSCRFPERRSTLDGLCGRGVRPSAPGAVDLRRDRGRVLLGGRVFSQLTGVPAELSERSVAARLALGVQFDLVDVFWYPAGVVPLAALHALLASRNSSRREAIRDY